ncbi:Dnaaf3 [Symbiodinium sp. CCMP2592]|nr:Dnaaf3 [Symbiodinium sp. CCMP2592]
MLVKTRGVQPHALAYDAYAKAHFLAARPSVAVEIMQKKVDAGVDQASYRHAVNYLQYVLVACYSSGCTVFRRRLTRHIAKWSTSIARESSTTGKRNWHQLTRAADKLLSEQDDFKLTQALVTYPAREQSAMKDWTEWQASGADHKDHRDNKNALQTPKLKAKLEVARRYRHTETDIAEYNLTAYLSEMETGQRFTLPPEKPEEFTYPYASPLDELRAADKVVEVKEEDEKKVVEDAPPRGRREKKVNWPPLSEAMEGVEVVLLAGDLKEVLKKPKYKGLFHRAFVGAMGCMPLFEEMGIVTGAGGRVPGDFAKKREESGIAASLADGAEIICETMKYQAHFEGSTRLGFRHRLAQAGHLAGWRLRDERRALPRLEKDMQERQSRAKERNSTDFMRFVAMPGGKSPEAS